MCVLFVGWQVRKDAPLVVAANRDEAYSRPAEPAGWWPDALDVLAGRDLQAGGTWMGTTRAGRWAVVTNVRSPEWMHRRMPCSRGDLVADFLRGEMAPEAYAEALAGESHLYAGFNLLVGDADTLVYTSHAQPEPRVLAPGFYGLSNAVLDTPWPKVSRGGKAFEHWALGPLDEETGLALLRDDRPAPDDLLPDTGVGLELERVLSPLFIVTEGYGTRASTLLIRYADGSGRYVERTYGPGGHAGETIREPLPTP